MDGLAAENSLGNSPSCVERVIGSIRRECLDHVVVLNEKYLKRLLNHVSQVKNYGG